MAEERSQPDEPRAPTNLRDIINNRQAQPEFVPLPEVPIDESSVSYRGLRDSDEEEEDGDNKDITGQFTDDSNPFVSAAHLNNTPIVMAEGLKAQFKIEAFSGLQFENAENWLNRFQALAKLNDWKEEQTIVAFRLSLTGPAEVWYDALQNHDPEDKAVPSKHDLQAIYQAFKDKYINTSSWLKETQLSRRKQGRGETVEAYAAALRQQMAQLKKTPREMLTQFVLGLRDDIKEKVIVRDPKDLDDAEYAARLCESASAINNGGPTVAVTDTLTDEVKELKRCLLQQGEKIQAISTEKTTARRQHQGNSSGSPDGRHQTGQPFFQPTTETFPQGAYQQMPDQSYYQQSSQQRYQPPYQQPYQLPYQPTPRRQQQGYSPFRPQYQPQRPPQQPQYRRPQRQFTSQPHNERPTCTRCLKVGHQAHDCRGQIVCYGCGRTGHTRRDCFRAGNY